MAAIQGDWYVSDGMGFTARPDGHAADYFRYVYSIQPDGTKYVVAKVWAGDDSDYEGTARLVSAAPDLLEACELLLIYLGDWNDTDDETCVAARKAIAKAQGRSE